MDLLGMLSVAEAEVLLLPAIECPEIAHGGIYLDDDRRVVIGGFRDEWFGRSCSGFKLGDEHNLYEWAMALSDRHPHAPLWFPGVDEESRQDIRLTAIGLWEESQAIPGRV
jgi:hypothetical protein